MCRSGRRTVATVTAVGWVPRGALHQPPCKKVPEHIWVPAGALKSHDRSLFAAKPLDWHPFTSLWSLIFICLEHTSSLGERAQELEGWRVHKCANQSSQRESYGCDCGCPKAKYQSRNNCILSQYALFYVFFFLFCFFVGFQLNNQMWHAVPCHPSM